MENASAIKAVLLPLDKNGNPVQPGLACHFNPKEYMLTKANQWTKSKTSGKNLPHLEFSSGEPATLQLELLFDTFEQQKDVRVIYTNKLWDLMMVDPKVKPQGKDNKQWPPMVQFQWGKFLSFKAAIVNMTQKFTLFLADGTPVRATVNMTLKQTYDPTVLENQNPTSAGEGGEQFWTVGEGETLLGIAYKVYGSPNKWRRIAEANRLTRVRRLVPGTVLEIPS